MEICRKTVCECYSVPRIATSEDNTPTSIIFMNRIVLFSGIGLLNQFSLQAGRLKPLLTSHWDISQHFIYVIRCQDHIHWLPFQQTSSNQADNAFYEL